MNELILLDILQVSFKRWMDKVYIPGRGSLERDARKSRGMFKIVTGLELSVFNVHLLKRRVEQ